MLQTKPNLTFEEALQRLEEQGCGWSDGESGDDEEEGDGHNDDAKVGLVYYCAEVVHGGDALNQRDHLG